MNARTSIRGATYGLCLILIGCATPTHHSLSHVDGGVLARTGHDLGAPMPSNEFGFHEWVEFEDGLSEEEAIAVGLWNNPGYRELLADLEITRADIIEAAQVRNPLVNTMVPLGPKQWEFALLVPLDVLWLRPIRVSAAVLESQRVAERLVQDGLNVVRDIRVAHINWELAEQLAQLAREGADLRNEVARVAEARLSAGDLAELDVSAIRLDAVVGMGEAARTERDAELAAERLRYLMGIQFASIPLFPSTKEEPFVLNADVDELVIEALASRPDLEATLLAVEAAKYRAELAGRDIWQLSSWLPDINSRGRKGSESGPGLQFSVPLFHQNQGAIALAEAEAERLQRQYENQRGMATLEVHQAHLQYLQAGKDLEIWQGEVLPQARASVESSQSALQEGAISLLLVLETTRQFITAQQREREASAEVKRAVAELERAVGRRLFDVTPVATLSAEGLSNRRVEWTGESP